MQKLVLNSEMSDKPFMVKMEMEGGFKESALRLNSYLVKLSGWNENHIKERAKLLSDKAKDVWEYPKISEEEIAPYCVEEKQHRSIHWIHMILMCLRRHYLKY